MAVIVTYDSAQVLGACVDSLERAASRAGRPVDTIVVDNADQDRLARQHAEICAVRGVRYARAAANRGFAAGVNEGVGLVPDADLLLLLNPDAQLDIDALGPLLDASADGFDLVAPRHVADDGRGVPSVHPLPSTLSVLAVLARLVVGRPATARLRRTWAWRTAVGRTRWSAFADDERPPSGLQTIDLQRDYPSAACWLVRANTFRALGGLDEGYFLYCEDADFCVRLARHPGSTAAFVNSACLIHERGRSGGAATYESGRVMRPFLRFLRRHRGRPAFTMARAGTAIAGRALVAARGPRRLLGDQLTAAAHGW